MGRFKYVWWLGSRTRLCSLCRSKRRKAAVIHVHVAAHYCNTNKVLIHTYGASAESICTQQRSYPAPPGLKALFCAPKSGFHTVKFWRSKKDSHISIPVQLTLFSNVILKRPSPPSKKKPPGNPMRYAIHQAIAMRKKPAHKSKYMFLSCK